MSDLPEIWMSAAASIGEATRFPATCPVCAAVKLSERNGTNVSDFLRRAAYACGAEYTHKAQIQNHTEKWWGTCPKGKE